MKKIGLTLLLVVFSVFSYAQDKPKGWYIIDSIHYESLSKHDRRLMDSILPIYHNTTNDSVKLPALYYLLENMENESVGLGYNDVLLKLTENNPGRLHQKYYGAATNNLAYIANLKGNISKAISLLTKALEIRTSIHDTFGIAETLHNLGSQYRAQNDVNKALVYYLKALKMQEAAKHILPNTVGAIGGIYAAKKEYSKALAYYLKALVIAQEQHKAKYIIGAYNNLGNMYRLLEKPLKAIECYTTAIKIADEAGAKEVLSTAYIGLSTLYFKENNNVLAEKYALQSYQLGMELGFPQIIRNASELLYKIYRNENKPKYALVFFEQYIQMRDSINNAETSKTLTNIEYNAKEAQTQAKQELRNKIQAEESKRQKTIIWSISGVLVLVFILVLFALRGYYQKKKANILISKQKQEVEYSRKEIIDSINYAKLIQQAIFKEEEHVSEHLPPHFIFFKSKDIVSGDFYWSFEKGDYLYIAAADCTGHGVPGAFLTMLGISFLNEINAKEELLTPTEILNQLRDKVVKQLGKQGQTKDGMDISLIRLNLKNKELIWAGAYNPLWYISNHTLHEIKADKQPIGYSEKPMPFTNHVVNLNPADTIYLFTDGYADQFGGINGKKFKYKQLAELLLANYHLSMEEQKNILSQSFKTWKGDLEQVDDVTLIGIKI